MLSIKLGDFTLTVRQKTSVKELDLEAAFAERQVSSLVEYGFVCLHDTTFE